MKIYAHVEIEKPCTLIIHTNGRTTIEEFKLEVLKRYASKLGSQLSPTEVSVRTKYKKPVEGCVKVEDYFEPLDDIFIVSKTAPIPTASKVEPPKPVSKLGANVIDDLLLKAKQETTRNHFKTASDCYEQILADNPSHKDALVALMDLWVRIGRPLMVEHWCDESVRSHSTDLDFIISAGKLKQYFNLIQH